jgi:hypothetical protein
MSPLRALPACLLLSLHGAASDFGFRDLEIYKMQSGVQDLACGEFNGDGRMDLALIDNARSRIEILVRLDPEAESVPDPEYDARDANALRHDGRFQRMRHSEERRALRLAVGDLDGDGRDEIAYAASGGELVVLLDVADDKSRRALTLELEALRSGCGVLHCADWNQDGLDDLIFTGDDEIVLLESTGEGRFAAPVTLDVTRGTVDAIQVVDWNGDGAEDLVCLHHDEDYPLRFLLRRPDGKLGPRFEVEAPQFRSSAMADVDGDGRAELLAVFRQSGRLACFAPQPPPEARLLLSHYALRAQGREKTKRTYGVGDLQGDGGMDVVVADPEAAAVSLFTSAATGGALQRTTSPSLVGVSDPRIGDVDGDGERELVVVSGPERMIGIASPEGERFPFPRTLPLEGEPAAMDLADMNGDGIDDLILVVSSGEGRNRSTSIEVRFGSEGGLSPEPAIRRELESVRKIPDAVRAMDLDRDGRPDCLVFVPGGSEVPLILMNRDEGLVGDWGEGEIPGLGILEGADPARIAHVDCDGDGAQEALVAAGNLARTLLVEADAETVHPRVLEQFNVPAADVRISGCTAADLLGDAQAEILLQDERSNQIMVMARSSEGAGRILERLDVGRLGAAELVPADVDGDGRAEVLALGQEGFAVLALHDAVPALRQVGLYEPTEAGDRLDRICSGDLDHDGALDLVVSEVSEHALVILKPALPSLRAALGFRVFEQKSFRRDSEGREPRELSCADFSGDGKDDLALLVHDKLILYIQQ